MRRCGVPQRVSRKYRVKGWGRARPRAAAGKAGRCLRTAPAEGRAASSVCGAPSSGCASAEAASAAVKAHGQRVAAAPLCVLKLKVIPASGRHRPPVLSSIGHSDPALLRGNRGVCLRPSRRRRRSRPLDIRGVVFRRRGTKAPAYHSARERDAGRRCRAHGFPAPARCAGRPVLPCAAAVREARRAAGQKKRQGGRAASWPAAPPTPAGVLGRLAQAHAEDLRKARSSMSVTCRLFVSIRAIVLLSSLRRATGGGRGALRACFLRQLDQPLGNQIAPSVQPYGILP